MRVQLDHCFIYWVSIGDISSIQIAYIFNFVEIVWRYARIQMFSLARFRNLCVWEKLRSALGASPLGALSPFSTRHWRVLHRKEQWWLQKYYFMGSKTFSNLNYNIQLLSKFGNYGWVNSIFKVFFLLKNHSKIALDWENKKDLKEYARWSNWRSR